MILLTGATGLVGSHVLYSLTRKGYKIRATKRETSNLQQVETLFRYYSGDDAPALLDNVEWVAADVSDYYSIEEALDGVTHVVHAAAKVSFNPGEAARMLEVNAVGTANLVNACINKGVEKLVYVSSISSLGRHPDGKEVDEDVEWQPDDNRSAYSHSKFRAEMEVWRASKEGLPVIIVNPSVVIGPIDWKRSSGRLFYSVLRGMPFYTTGVTGFVDVRDVAESIVLLLNSDVINERFILNGENLSFKDFFSKVARAIGKRSPFINATPWMAEIGWRMNHLLCLLVGKAPAITKDTARAAHNKSYYSAGKFTKYFDFTFSPIDNAIGNTMKWYKTTQSKN